MKLFAGLLWRIKSVVAWTGGRLLAGWQGVCPVKLTPIRLSWGATWLAGWDYASLALRLGKGFEKEEEEFLLRFLRKGWIFLDVGAHHGFYTLLASYAVGEEGRVIAFEPSPRELERLKKHLEINRCPNVQIKEVALGRSEEKAVLHVCESIDTGCNSLRKPRVMERTRRVEVDVMSLDVYCRDEKIHCVDFIKIDVEGGEYEVLRGAGTLLQASQRPFVMFELSDWRTKAWEYRSKDLRDYMEKLDYEFYVFRPGGILKPAPVLNEYNQNVLAVPGEKKDIVKEYLCHD